VLQQAYSPAQLYKEMEVAFQHLDTEVAKGMVYMNDRFPCDSLLITIS
jgi:hypothetical protein